MPQGFTRYILQHSRSISSEGATEIHVIFDKYNSTSTKNQTRESRGARHTNIHIQPSVAVPSNWKQFLSSGENKQNLAKYYTDYMSEHASSHLNSTQALYISGGMVDKVVKIQNGKQI